MMPPAMFGEVAPGETFEFELPAEGFLGPGMGQAAGPWFEASLPMSLPTDLLTHLRMAASKLDDAADLLESINEFESADRLRTEADRLRGRAREQLHEPADGEKHAESELELIPPVAEPFEGPVEEPETEGTAQRLSDQIRQAFQGPRQRD
ncbi:MAG: hypothetical protein K1X74_18045 [Pirellulales bacterium]|nr:hypothetical protein [Pirellulales bacterium]